MNRMLNTMKFELPNALRAVLDAEALRWSETDKTARIWQRDASVWTDDDEGKWLGWLAVVDKETAASGRYATLSRDIADAGFTDVLLMGMGGSSLCPEVLAKTFGKKHFHILDSTVPAQVRAVAEKISIEKTLFVVASKSGSTLEPNCFFQYFFDLVSRRNDNPGKQFVAITDPGSKMERIARDNKFRHIFHGKPDIGGRFSALSAFGLTAAAAMGLDVDELLASADVMIKACRSEKVEENRGVQLGLLLGVCHAAGRDKLTIVASRELTSVGAWLEQLVAESTGKSGVAIIPVDGERVQNSGYRHDRVFVLLCIRGNSEHDEIYSSLSETGHPVIMIEMESTADLAQEFFRWEFATAVAGSLMQVNPFNQPDVESAKIEARRITDEYERVGTLPEETPFFSDGPLELFSDAEFAAPSEGNLSSILRSHLDRIESGDYFALLAYVEMNAVNARLLQEVRSHVQSEYAVATCLGFGPRFLHSTGQAYKGGANNGVFLQLTSDDAFDIAVPNQRYSFGVVKAAQARGDFQVLLDRGRRALRVHLGPDVEAGLRDLVGLLTK